VTAVIQPPEVATLTDFTSHATEAIERLKETGQPQVLTVDGRAEAVVLDVASYERLLELADRADAIRGIREGLESAARGEGIPAAEAYARIRAKLGLSSSP
jgi:prevent-host-death family protein